jgi:RNA polymerase sigma-70 factor, ECF subfamily
MLIFPLITTETHLEEELIRPDRYEFALSERVHHDPAAFQEFYERYFSRIYNYIICRVGETQAAEDLTARVFEQALDRLPGYQPQRAGFGSWLFGIARNTLNYHLRFKMRHKWLPLEAAAHMPSRSLAPEQQYIYEETRQELIAALSKLSQRDRDLLGLKFGGRLTNRKIAELTGMTESAASVALFRAIERLRKALGVEVRA